VDRRHPYREFTPDLIEEFLVGRQVVGAERLAAGNSNTNYRLTLDDATVVALRLYGGNGAAREAAAMRLVQGLVPVPEQLAGGAGWAIFEFLEGTLLAQSPELSGAAAAALARIASVRLPAAGWIQADGSVTPFEFGGEEGGFVEQVLRRPEVETRLGEERIRGIRDTLSREAGRLEELGAETRLVHGDFNPTNILVREGRITGVLDWEFSHAGTPYMDIGNLLRNTGPGWHPSIRAGLEAGGFALPADWQERAELVDLGSHLEFLITDRAEAFKQLCVERIDRFLTRFAR
jgi:aminoglycoside phosphotransferase (APT) family kinase protein